MFVNRNDEIKRSQAHTVVEHVLSSGEVGFFAWHMLDNTFELLENISGLAFNDLTTLPDFIDKIAFTKDRDLALQDLRNFMKGGSEYYQSTYRIIDSEGKVKWVFCKGIIIEGNILSSIIYDVTGNKFMKGHDPTTNLIDGRYFMRKLKNSIQLAQNHNRKGALIYLNIDNFYSIINSYGFEFGSAVLYKLSRKLLKFIGEYDELARFPYDKFMIMLKNSKDVSKVEQLSKKIINSFKDPLIVNDTHIYLNVSIGITLFPEASTDADELMKFSDFAVNHSHVKGSNTVTFFDSSLMESYTREIDIENELANAINNQELFVMYQPQLDLASQKVVGFEALLRWNNKQLGRVSPDEFIKVAEDKGLIVELGRFVLKESLKTVRKWLDMGFDFETMSINFSTLEFNQKDFQKHLLKECKKYNVSPDMIELEITERLFTGTTDNFKNVIDNLKNEGFKIAVDDFGTGYSNVSFLLNQEINTLKLDKSFIENITNKKHKFFLKSIIELKNYMNYNVVAEGVETKEELDILTEIGCDHIQGYYFSKPMTKSDAETFMLQRKSK